MFNYDEKRLIRRAQDDDPDAFNALMEKYEHKVYDLILRRTRDVETAKDLCQETWIKVFLGMKNFRGDSVFYVWVCRIAQNTFLDYLRKKKEILRHGSPRVIYGNPDK